MGLGQYLAAFAGPPCSQLCMFPHLLGNSVEKPVTFCFGNSECCVSGPSTFKIFHGGPSAWSLCPGLDSRSHGFLKAQKALSVNEINPTKDHVLHSEKNDHNFWVKKAFKVI